MPVKPHILAISGSTRNSSTNLNLILAIRDLYNDRLDISVYNELAALPQFNPDLDNDHPPAGISAFREKLQEAEGVLICTPEYAMGVPGSLKNALDWVVSSGEFTKKPTALITASTSGQKGHRSLLETLTVIDVRMSAGTNLLISFVKTKVKDQTITDIPTYSAVCALMDTLIEIVHTTPHE